MAQARQIYLIGTMLENKFAVILWELGWFTDRTAAAKAARDSGYDVIPIRKNPTQP